MKVLVYSLNISNIYYKICYFFRSIFYYSFILFFLLFWHTIYSEIINRKPRSIFRSIILMHDLPIYFIISIFVGCTDHITCDKYACTIHIQNTYEHLCVQ